MQKFALFPSDLNARAPSSSHNLEVSMPDYLEHFQNSEAFKMISIEKNIPDRIKPLFSLKLQLSESTIKIIINFFGFLC